MLFARSGVIITRSAICWAASRYRSIIIGGTYNVAPLVSNPAPPVPSAGNNSETVKTPPPKPRTLLCYSRPLGPPHGPPPAHPPPLPPAPRPSVSLPHT